jgi:hypothetical protein
MLVVSLEKMLDFFGGDGQRITITRLEELIVIVDCAEALSVQVDVPV